MLSKLHERVETLIFDLSSVWENVTAFPLFFYNLLFYSVQVCYMKRCHTVTMTVRNIGGTTLMRIWNIHKAVPGMKIHLHEFTSVSLCQSLTQLIKIFLQPIFFHSLRSRTIRVNRNFAISFFKPRTKVRMLASQFPYHLFSSELINSVYNECFNLVTIR